MEDFDQDAYLLLSTLAEIQRILYLSDDQRTQKEVLRLHNVCFLHFVLLKRVISSANMQKITHQNLYGKYMHNLLVKAPVQLRIISGDSTNVEDEERVFNSIRNCSNSTTNNWPGHIIANIFARLQVEFQNKKKYGSDAYQNSALYNEISSMGKDLLSDESNTLFPYKLIKEQPLDWLAHLQRIADFLVFGEVWWKKTAEGVEFFDVNEPGSSFHPKLHHFRSANIRSVTNELKSHWNKIITDEICIPAHVNIEENPDETFRYLPTDYLTPYLIYQEKTKVSRRHYELPQEEESPDSDEIDVQQINEGEPEEQPSDFSSKECHEIHQVLGENDYLTKYNHGVSVIQGLREKNPFLEGVLMKFRNELMLQIKSKLVEWDEELKKWERSFIASNHISAPTKDDYLTDPRIAELKQKMTIANKVLKYDSMAGFIP